MSIGIGRYTSWAVTASGTTSASVGQAGAASVQLVVTDFSAGGDLASKVTIEAPAGTIIWWGSAPVGAYVKSFEPGALVVATNTQVVAKCYTGTASCCASIAGFKIPG